MCRPEEDLFLIIQSNLQAIEPILQRQRRLPLRHTWIEQPCDKEEVTRSDERVMSAIQLCLKRVNELDQWMLAVHYCCCPTSLMLSEDASPDLEPDGTLIPGFTLWMDLLCCILKTMMVAITRLR